MPVASERGALYRLIRDDFISAQAHNNSSGDSVPVLTIFLRSQVSLDVVVISGAYTQEHVCALGNFLAARSVDLVKCFFYQTLLRIPSPLCMTSCATVPNQAVLRHFYLALTSP